MSTPFDRPLYGYRFVLTRHGDTLQRIAARELEKDGFLLPEDAAIIIQSAAENPLWRAAAP